MKFLCIGLGAAGNKMAINLVEKGIVDLDDIKLINSTLKDIPTKYKEYAIRLSDSQQGAAQERARGKEMAVEAIKSGRLNLDGICDPQHQKVIILTSLSGGTGSGSSVVIAKYLKDVVGIAVEIIGVMPFKDEGVRALRNTVEFCQDLENDYIIQLIQNETFLAKASGNRRLAEEYANDDIAKRILISKGDLIQEAVQNIDDADLYKLEMTPGYKMVERIPVREKIKSHEQFNYLLKTALDNSASVEPEVGGMKRLGMVFNLSRSSQEFIDYSYVPIVQRLGNPYEKLEHVETIDGGEFIAIIAAGLKMPIDKIKEIYEEYEREVQKVDTSNDEFFDQVRQMKGSTADNMFDMGKPGASWNQGSKENFFQSFDKKSEPVKEQPTFNAVAERNPTVTKVDFLNSEW